MDSVSDWSSIFDSVQAQISSLDSDSSTSDYEDEVPIFRRPHFSLLPEETADLESSALGESKIQQELLMSQTGTQAYQSGGKIYSSQHIQDNMSCQISTGSVLGTVESHVLEASASSDLLKGEQDQSCVVVQDKHEGEAAMLSLDSGDSCLKNIGTDTQSAPSPSEKPFFLETEPDVVGKNKFPLLSMKPLEHWDMDQVLQTLKQNRPSVYNTEVEEPVQMQPGYRGFRGMSEDSLLEKLAALCKKQAESGRETDRRRGAVKTFDNRDKAPVKCPSQFRSGRWTKSFERMAAGMHRSQQDSSTVYIDLRSPDPPTSITDPVNFDPPTIQRSPFSRDKLRHRPTPSAEQNGHYMGFRSTTVKGDVTGKTLLLQKLREVNRKKAGWMAAVSFGKQEEHPQHA